MSSPPLPELVRDPRWFPFDLDRQTGAIRFADVGEGWPDWNRFFSHTEKDGPIRQQSLPAPELLKLAGGEPPRLNFIWHTAYCCSTAIAKALEVPGRSTAHLEPQVLISLAHTRRQSDREARGDLAWLSEAVFRLLARPYASGASATVKPAPTSSYLTGDAALKTKGRMLFLYSDCKSFLLSTLRYGEHRRRFVRSLFRDIRAETRWSRRWTPEAMAEITDLEVASLVWQLQIVRFRESMLRLGDRAASLDCETFLAEPRTTIETLWHYFELPGRPDESPLIADAGYLNRHAKFAGQEFARDRHREAARHVAPEVLAEVERIAEASYDLFPENRGALPLARPLLGASLTP
ncbi:MAG: hypothetical protein JO261_05515 [Alphaproteobacteria bacterium]|nr:hypothetical protein [Alphaproteobacteria bacterium]MBV9693140.1 hypothetical protein [Alphaproteobacteria bacterium]